MLTAENTVFISYRRAVSKHLARAIFIDLRSHNYDVFLDVDTIDSGNFDQIILNQIAARAHFVLLLSPGSLERCKQPDDWLRREIEEAIRLQRNIIPVLDEGVDFEREMQFLKGTKADDLRRYNSLPLVHFYFDAAMDALRNRFLKQPFYGSITPAPASEQAAVQQKIEQAAGSLNGTASHPQTLVAGHAALSDIGKVRGNNQDTVFAEVYPGVSPEYACGLFIVADGMGGHIDGERASRIAVDTFEKHLRRELGAFMEGKHTIASIDITEAMRNSFEEANKQVTRQVPEGGTTLTAALVVQDTVYIAHVGDSRAYAISEKNTEQLTRDHSLVQRLIELDQLTPEEAATYPQRNVLYRALGQSDTLDVDMRSRKISEMTHLLLCSDGLWNNVPNPKMNEMVNGARNEAEACQQMVNWANAMGGTDNISVVLVRF